MEGHGHLAFLQFQVSASEFKVSGFFLRLDVCVWKRGLDSLFLIPGVK